MNVARENTRAKTQRNYTPNPSCREQNEPQLAVGFWFTSQTDTRPQLFLQNRRISLDLFLNILKMWQKVECSGW